MHTAWDFYQYVSGIEVIDGEVCPWMTAKKGKMQGNLQASESVWEDIKSRTEQPSTR